VRGAVAIGLWLFVLHLVVVGGWLVTQSLDELLEPSSVAG
jgi:membrane protein